MGLHKLREGLITSQIDTAPKPDVVEHERFHSLITSQIDTAPKLLRGQPNGLGRLITSQIDTAPKQSVTPYNFKGDPGQKVGP